MIPSFIGRIKLAVIKALPSGSGHVGVEIYGNNKKLRAEGGEVEGMLSFSSDGCVPQASRESTNYHGAEFFLLPSRMEGFVR